MKTKLVFLSLFALIVVGFAAAWAAKDYARFLAMPLNINEPQLVEVDAGRSQAALIRDWAQKGWLRHAQRDPLWLRLHQRVQGDAATIKIGEYEIRPGRSLLQALAIIQRGETLRYNFTLIEGWRFSELRQALAARKELKQTTAEWSDAQIMAALDTPELHPEGQFLPETYSFIKGATDLDILRQANKAMENTLRRVWAQRAENLPIDNAYEALILASIVEKETGVADERPLIAGVFVNRLRKGMRLQTDPTVIYGMGDKFDGNIRRQDLRTDTPYNTYTRAGLPPTPIALPGEAALLASVRPQSTDKYYFVATGEGGRHYFSTNLREHQDAVRRYQLNK